MFNSFSNPSSQSSQGSSPFSATNNKNKTSGKQSTLALFISSSKPAHTSTQNKPFLSITNLKRKPDFLYSKHKESETIVIDDDDKDPNVAISNKIATKKPKINSSQLPITGKENKFIDVVEIIDTDDDRQTPNNFKYMKPIERRSFDSSSITSSMASSGIKLSNFNTTKHERSLKVPVKKTKSSASKQRQLPWLGLSNKKISNPRLQTKQTSFSQQTSNGLTSEGFKLSKEQEMVIDLVLKEKKNLFYTGSAGTGKSFLLRQLIKKLKARYGHDSVAVTASTGLAATNIEGTTINRFSGIGLGTGKVESIVSKIKRNQTTKSRWQATKVLIIDEVSMIDSIIFDKLDFIAKVVRNSKRPFGGIQLILTGDFFQLPPVSLSRNNMSKFCFHANGWKECIDETILLTKVFRQQNDSDLIEMLNALRVGQLSAGIKQKFKNLERSLTYEDGIYPTELYPTREEVDRANIQRLNSLPGELITIHASDSMPDVPDSAKPYLSKQLDGLMCAKTLLLKEGAQIMYLKNDMDDPLIVNGSIGKIICFPTYRLWEAFTSSLKEYEQLKYDDCLIIACKFIGNKPSDEAIAMSNNYAYMNRKTSLASLHEALVMIAKSEPTSSRLPFSKFTVNSIEKYRLKLIQPKMFSVETNNKLGREQLPILLSWALSIHKSQGQTLSRVKVDLTKVFEKGQVYVALSRCVDTANLEIVNFDERRVKVSEEVVQFYENLKTMSV